MIVKFYENAHLLKMFMGHIALTRGKIHSQKKTSLS